MTYNEVRCFVARTQARYGRCADDYRVIRCEDGWSLLYIGAGLLQVVTHSPLKADLDQFLADVCSS